MLLRVLSARLGPTVSRSALLFLFLSFSLISMSMCVSLSHVSSQVSAAESALGRLWSSGRQQAPKCPLSLSPSPPLP